MDRRVGRALSSADVELRRPKGNRRPAFVVQNRKAPSKGVLSFL
jgi:hypothetical protein